MLWFEFLTLFTLSCFISPRWHFGGHLCHRQQSLQLAGLFSSLSRASPALQTWCPIWGLFALLLQWKQRLFYLLVGTLNSCDTFKLWINWLLFWHCRLVTNWVCCTFSVTDGLRKLFWHFVLFTLLYISLYLRKKGKTQGHQSLSKINKSKSNEWFWTFIHTNMILSLFKEKSLNFH